MPFKEDIQSTNIGDRSSSHNSTIQSTHFDAISEDNEYINRLFKGCNCLLLLERNILKYINYVTILKINTKISFYF